MSTKFSLETIYIKKSKQMSIKMPTRNHGNDYQRIRVKKSLGHSIRGNRGKQKFDHDLCSPNFSFIYSQLICWIQSDRITF